MSADEGELIRAVVPLKVQGYLKIYIQCGEQLTGIHVLVGWLETDVVYSELLLTLASNYLMLICGLRSDRVGKVHSSFQPSSPFYRV